MQLTKRFTSYFGGKQSFAKKGVARPDMLPEETAIWNAVQPFTMTSVERVLAVIDAARHVCNHGIDGSFVECGVWRGGSTMAVLHTLRNLRVTDRDVHLYDTYEGMPPPDDVDQNCKGVAAAEQLESTPQGTGVWCVADLDDVRSNVATVGYPADRIKFIQGKVEDTIPETIPDRIAILRLDTDWYESTRHELEHLYPRLVSGGILIIDDYGHWQGARKAVDEYLADLSTPVFLNRIDYTGRIAVKP